MPIFTENENIFAIHQPKACIYKMLINNILESFSPLITNWYREHQRDLPWRQTTDAYKIWLSEIILQQTRVNQGLNYYKRFIERWPTVTELALAEEEEVLKLWQGLGYYSRARNIHYTAKLMVERHKGVFPIQYKDVLALKGIGEYTAAAICSFAYNEPYAVVDGNVYRVLARVFGIETAIDSTQGKKQFAELAQTLLDKKNPGLHNQAIMEFGALHCTPALPDCGNCILNQYCIAFLNKTVDDLPKKSLKTKQRNRYFNYMYIENGDKIYINKREAKDVWQNLYELPLIESETELSFQELITTNDFKKIFETTSNINIQSAIFKTKHVLSHQKIYATFYKIEISNSQHINGNYLCINKTDLETYPISRLTELFFENL